MVQYYIDRDRYKQNNAANKAPDDIAKICSDLGMTQFNMPCFPKNRGWLYKKIWMLSVCPYYWSKLEKEVSNGDTIIYQHPMYGNRVVNYFISRIQRKKHGRFIAVIHDLESLRNGVSGITSPSQKTSELSDNILLKKCDVVICHNKSMKEYLVQQGFEQEKLIELKIFDYVSDAIRTQPPKCRQPSIAIAGNLAIGKCPYIYKIFGDDGLQNTNLTVHLYGSNYDVGKAQNNMAYHGSFTPEELPKHLEGDFGLVWDGTSAETCAGNTGEYLRYNNPHKTSLYLASGMPVIVWRQAAIADFVLENGVGIAVDSLYGLDERIAGISEEDYRNMCENVSRIGTRLRAGYYFRSAVEECMNRL